MATRKPARGLSAAQFYALDKMMHGYRIYGNAWEIGFTRNTENPSVEIKLNANVYGGLVRNGYISKHPRAKCYELTDKGYEAFKNDERGAQVIADYLKAQGF